MNSGMPTNLWTQNPIENRSLKFTRQDRGNIHMTFFHTDKIRYSLSQFVVQLMYMYNNLFRPLIQN